LKDSVRSIIPAGAFDKRRLARLPSQLGALQAPQKKFFMQPSGIEREMAVW
jgi:hypothetical protein